MIGGHRGLRAGHNSRIPESRCRPSGHPALDYCCSTSACIQPLARAWARYFHLAGESRKHLRRFPDHVILNLSHWPQPPPPSPVWPSGQRRSMSRLRLPPGTAIGTGPGGLAHHRRYRLVDTGISMCSHHVGGTSMYAVWPRSTLREKELIHLELRLRINSFTWLVGAPVILAGLTIDLLVRRLCSYLP
jgi:hypothetical protein